jgi:hypothetical protein
VAYKEYFDAVMADVPRVFWPLQEAASPQDFSGNALHLNSQTGTPDYQQPGPLSGYSIRCVGGEWLERTTQVSTVVDNFTMEVLVNIQAVTSDNQKLFYNGNSGANGYGIIVDVSGKFAYLCGGVDFGGDSVGAIVGNGFRHIVVTRTATQWRYYIDGVLDRENLGTTTPVTPSGTTLLGDAFLQTAYSFVALYQTALSAEKVAAHFRAMRVPAPDYSRFPKATLRRAA